MEKVTSVSGARRYAVSLLLIAVLVSVYLIDRHARMPVDKIATAPASPPAVAQASVMPEITNGTPVVPYGKATFHIDVIQDASGTHPVPDGAGPHVATSSGQPITILGWAVDSAAARPAAGVVGFLDGREKFVASFGGPRADVAKALNNQAYTASSFSLEIPAASLSTGDHSFRLLILSADRKKFYEAPQVVTISVHA